MMRYLIIAAVFLGTISGAYALPADENLIKSPEMVTRVRELMNSVTGQIRQALPDSQSDWEKCSQKGEGAFKSGNFGEAEKQLNLALKEAQKTTPPDKRLALSYHNLGVLYAARAQAAKAEPMFEKAVRELGKLQGPENPDVLINLARLGQFYVLQDKSTKADALCSKLVPLVDKKLKLDERVNEGLKQLHAFYSSDRQFGAALEALKKAQEATNQVFANQHLELAMSLDNFAAAYKIRKKYPPSEQLFKRALEIREKSLAADHMAVAVSYGNLASVYYVQGKYSEAAPLFTRAIDILEKRNVSDAKAVSELAGCYEGEGKCQQAENLYLKALSNLEKTARPGNPEIGRACNALAMFYRKQGKFAQAEPLLKRSLSIAEGMNGPQHSALVPLLENYADVLRKNNKAPQADQLIARAKAIRGM
jgi:tetratricopeptide (TPR) repeat protein